MKNAEQPRTSTQLEAPDGMDDAGALSKRTWDYRVMSFNDGEDAWQAIHEVQYLGDVPVMFSLGPVVVLWNSEEDGEAGRRCVERMREALDKPVLTPSDFPQTSD